MNSLLERLSPAEILAYLSRDFSSLVDRPTRMAEVRPDKEKTWREHNRVKREFKRQLMEKKLEKLEKKKAEKPEVKQHPTNAKCSNKFSTLSIAVPGSILDNAQSAELRSYLAGQIARAACIYCVDEVCFFVLKC